MRLAILLFIGIFSFTLTAHADDEDGLSPEEIKTLFFGKDHRQAISDVVAAPWDAIGQLETESGNLCTATLISAHLALTAGHCLLTPPGRFDKPVALRFMAGGKSSEYESHHTLVLGVASLVQLLDADAHGWHYVDV